MAVQGCYLGAKREFTLNDPVIHSSIGRKNMFGLTDHGNVGIHNFLAHHKCNSLCRALGLKEK